MAEFQDKRPPPPSVYSIETNISRQYQDTLCYRCSSEFDRQRGATWHCVECSESFCQKCYPEHFRNKRENWSHTIKDMAGINPFNQKKLPKQAPVKYLDTSCTHCSRDNKAVRAIRYCKDCETNLCTTCYKGHNDNDRYISHTMKRVWEKEMEKEENCPEHPEEVISRYCKDHDIVCCIKCIHLNHRNCKLKEEKHRIEEGIDRNQTYLSIKENINKAKMNILSLIKARKDDMKRIKDERYNIKVEIQTARERVNDHLDRLEKKSKQELKIRYEQFVAGIDQDLKQLEEMLSKLELEASKLQTWEEDNESQQFINLKKAEQITRESNILEMKEETAAGSEYLNFNLNIKIIDTFCDTQSLGEFSFFSLALSKVFKVNTIKDMAVCNITDSCLMSDGSIVLADFSNSCIKKLDLAYNVTTECKLYCSPIAICSVSPTDVAIGLFSVIQFATVTRQISVKNTRSFTVDGTCNSISYSKGELFIALRKFSPSDNAVQVYNISGKLLRSFVLDIGGSYFVTISSAGDMIHHAHTTLGLLTTDRRGHKLWENTDLKEIYSLTTTEKDCLIVCCKHNDKIAFLLIDKDGKKITELTVLQETPNPKSLTSILYDATNSKLIVSFRNSDTIYVYNVKLT